MDANKATVKAFCGFSCRRNRGFVEIIERSKTSFERGWDS
jgi:hypothetical protein